MTLDEICDGIVPPARKPMMTQQEVFDLVEEMKLALGLTARQPEKTTKALKYDMCSDAMVDMMKTGTGITMDCWVGSSLPALEFEDYPLPIWDTRIFSVDEPIPEPVQPQLPPEVHHTQEFNASAAWEAVVALARGSGC